VVAGSFFTSLFFGDFELPSFSEEPNPRGIENPAVSLDFLKISWKKKKNS